MTIIKELNYVNVGILALTMILCFGCASNTSSEEETKIYNELKQGFLDPPESARPKVYWWCLNGNIDTVRAKQELQAMKDAGIGGFDLFEIGVPKEDTMIPGGPAFLSDQSLKSIKFVIDEAKKLDLSLGLNVASSWNAGGKWIKPEHAAKSLYVSKIIIQGNTENLQVELPFPEISFPKKSLSGRIQKPILAINENGKPDYYEDIAILAIPLNHNNTVLDTSQIINVTRFFNPGNEKLYWDAPPGEWEIHRYVCSNSGRQLVLPSPLSAGLVIDHFDSTAVEIQLMYVINRLKTVLGDFQNTALKSFYLASYEAKGFTWTSSLASEFKKINGYDIYKYIPLFFSDELYPEDVKQKVQADFKRTLSELMINNLYRKSKEISNEYGLKINCEAGGPGYPLYNGPAEPLKALGSLDIPRGEFWVNHSNVYTDNKGNKIDVLNVVKEVSAASHIYQKRIVEEEAFTSFQQWQEGPFDLKPLGDRAFCEGMNRVVFHGFSHNITGSGFPGYVYHAGTHMNDKRVWWPKIKPFIQYLSRLSCIFQETDFVSDVVYYYGDKIPNSATPKNTHFSVGSGYDYEVINTEILLNDLQLKEGKLVLSNGAEFSILALEDEDLINPYVLIKLHELAKQGAKIVGKKPEGIKTLKDQPLTFEEGKKLIENLWSKSNNIQEIKAGKIYSEIKPVDLLNTLNISPDINYSDIKAGVIDFIHYQKNNLDFYFLRNTRNQWISSNFSFRQHNKEPEIWDPVSGEIAPVIIYKHQENITSLPLSLPPYGSQLIVFRNNENNKGHFTQISNGTDSVPLFQYTKNGISLLENGEVELSNSKDETFKLNNKQNSYEITGGWDIMFPEGWGAPEKTTFKNLISWTESEIKGIKYFSGTATYHKTFHFKNIISENEQHFLDLGELSKVGEVWLNGKYLGIVWAKPFRFDVTKILKQGENKLIIEVANTWSNRLTGDAITGEKFTNTNIRNTIVAKEGISAGDQTRVPWAEVPLIKSGLIGPVKILSAQKITAEKVNK